VCFEIEALHNQFRNRMDIEAGTSAPEEEMMYLVFTCSHGHNTPVYPFPKGTRKIVHPGRCSFAVPHVAKQRIDVGFALVDRPVAVWFSGGK
jgi:hypothetical protein